MKSKFFLALVGIAAMFTSCNNDLVPETDGTTKQVTFQVAADQGLNTRADATGINNFLIEVYTDAAYTTAANVFTNGTESKATSTTGSFLMTLDKTKAYYCLLWADRDASVYTTSNLKQVTLVDGKAPVEAWQGKYTIAAGATEPTTSLKRAVAKITLLETGTLKAGTLTMAFKQKTVFNVSTGATTTTESDRSESISVAAIETANPAGQKINGNDIFVLASTTDAEQPTITFKMGDAAEEISVSNVPLKANYNTNIKGHFIKENGVTLKVTCDDVWAGNNDKEFPKYAIGDLYPSSIAPIGKVFYISDGGAHGKIVAMNQEVSANWAAAQTFAKKTENGLSWDLPTLDELCYLWCAYNGVTPTTWNIDTKPTSSYDAEAQSAFSTGLTTGFDFYYWSCEGKTNTAQNRCIMCFQNNNNSGLSAQASMAEANYIARAVASF